MPSNQRYLSLYETQREAWSQSLPNALETQRQMAATVLAEQGLPGKRVERYKYTSAEEAFSGKYELTTLRSATDVAVGESAVDVCATIVVEGDSVMTPTAPLPAGLELTSFSALGNEVLSQFYHVAAAQELPNELKHRDRTERDSVTALNTLLLREGVFVRIAAGSKLEAPIRIVLRNDSSQPTQTHRRLIVVAEAESEAEILIEESCTGDAAQLSTMVSEIYLERGAKLRVYSNEQTHERNTRFANVYLQQHEQSQFTHTALALSTGLSRTMINARLLGEGADCQNIGAAVARGKQHIENNLVVDHAVPECTSDMLYKYVMDKDSFAVFAGKVMVRPDAQKTYSQQTNNNILLSPTARVRSLPMLEIYADDVRCNHGSTVGTLDETALLYLRQRGIPEAEAKLLLQHAFVAEVLERIENEAVRDYFAQLVEARFAQA